jgi:hypothetical protein
MGESMHKTSIWQHAPTRDRSLTIRRPPLLYILARLDRDGHAGLAAKVRAGTMSANAAAIEAGFRKTSEALSEVRTRVVMILVPPVLRRPRGY